MKFVICLIVSYLCLTSAENKLQIIETEAQFDEQLKNAGNGLVVVEFCVKWATPCIAMKTILEKLAVLYENVAIFKVDIEKMKDLGTRFKISAVPAYVFLKDGQFIESFLGAESRRLEHTIMKLNN
ncbi:thioredoxin-like [Sitodiplosis mosellana]|uniref:thioredoxin-like n=1 Tax=Sitodiplosis mosellana TaxID=263140 RepID=UPI002443CB14|nr:thioredoxin-like [Sitodiplosis mosellana]